MNAKYLMTKTRESKKTNKIKKKYFIKLKISSSQIYPLLIATLLSTSLFADTFAVSASQDVAGLPTSIKANKWSQKTGCPTVEELKGIINSKIQQPISLAGVSVSVLSKTCGEFNYAIGYSDLSTKSPLTVDTLMQTQSNSQYLVVALLLKVMEDNPSSFPSGVNTKLSEILNKNNNPIFTTDGKVNLLDGTQINIADPLFYKQITGSSYCQLHNNCPDFSQVTVNHILLQKSGYYDFRNNENIVPPQFLPGYILQLGNIIGTNPLGIDAYKYEQQAVWNGPVTDMESLRPKSDLEILQRYGVIKRVNSGLQRGSHNTDAALAAVIIQLVTGKSLNELLESYIIKPLKLKKNDMQFLEEPIRSVINRLPISKNYSLLLNDQEVNYLPQTLNPLLPSNILMITDAFLTFKSLASESFISSRGNQIDHLGDRGLYNFSQNGLNLLSSPGSSELYATPLAYVQFLRAYVNGSLLNQENQNYLQSSFEHDFDFFKPSIIPVPVKFYSTLGRMYKVVLPDESYAYISTGQTGDGHSIGLCDTDRDICVMVNFNTHFSWFDLDDALHAIGVPSQIHVISPTVHYLGFEEGSLSTVTNYYLLIRQVTGD